MFKKLYILKNYLLIEILNWKKNSFNLGLTTLLTLNTFFKQISEIDYMLVLLTLFRRMTICK